MASDRPFDADEARRTRLARGEAMQRARARRWERRKERVAQRLTRAGGTGLAVIIALIVYGFVIGPIGIGGLLLSVLLGLVAMTLAFGWSMPEADAGALDTAPPAELPAIADAWLDRQRRQLPRLAAPQIDAIAGRLATLETQLAHVRPDDPVAQDISRLLAKHLPELVGHYTRVPAEQRVRTIEEDGRTLDASLVEGLKAVETELGRASETLAASDRDAFRIQGKFLEARYKDEQ
ncbi:hypothetical protein [Sandarakinorhabdus sp.]|uniref:hypothetical protein n=1 Tax=Sandarakinorhabdus sp. TaxID=1916663 RepID=UPI00286DA046|nr:hypothetical protein [Sandarakinorhabdus sp.]